MRRIGSALPLALSLAVGLVTVLGLPASADEPRSPRRPARIVQVPADPTSPATPLMGGVRWH